MIDRHGRGSRGLRLLACNLPSHAKDGLGVSDGAGDTSQPTSGLDLGDEVQLLGCGGAPVLDLDGGEHSQLLAHHVGGDRNGAVADEVRAALAEPVADETALGVFERPGVIAEQAGGATTSGQADGVLNCEFIRTPPAGALGR